MRCIKCRKETPDAQLYCRHCGTRLDLNFKQITEELGKEIDQERKAETEAFFRWIMFVLLFVWISGMLFNQLWNKPPMPLVGAGYVSAVKVPVQYQEIQRPLIIPEVVQETKKP